MNSHKATEAEGWLLGCCRLTILSVYLFSIVRIAHNVKHIS